MARKCTDCGIRPQDTTVVGPELCTVCLEYAEMENVHQDHGDDHGTSGYPTDDCPVCHSELDTRYTKRTGHTNTAPKTRGSHAGCDHVATPKARAACRKLRAAGERDAAAGERPHRPGDADNQALVMALIEMQSIEKKSKK